jgi:FkbM family methyltransferase
MVRSVLRQLGMMVPQLRHLVESRAEAVAARDAAVAQLALASGESRRQVLDAMLASADPGAFLRTTLNGFPAELPRDTLRTMVHCIHAAPDKTLHLWVETAHLNWMMDRLAPGGTFLDVGASTGATALPVTKRFGESVRVIAYEPAEAAGGLLLATLARNGIGHVEVRNFAVSSTPGNATFREYLPDETGQTPWTPEASSLTGGLLPDLASKEIEVRVVTLDEDALPSLGGDPLVVKIDVEGFECEVLKGAERLIAERQPFFSIDIHPHPFGDGTTTTEAEARSLLEAKGYTVEMMGHVLLATPCR